MKISPERLQEIRNDLISEQTNDWMDNLPGCPLSINEGLALVNALDFLDKHAVIFVDVLTERARQNQKWGEQNHDNATWALIAGEEFGEVQQAILHDRFGGKAAGTTREELVQLVAVGLQWLECIDRNKTTLPCLPTLPSLPNTESGKHPEKVAEIAPNGNSAT